MAWAGETPECVSCGRRIQVEDVAPLEPSGLGAPVVARPEEMASKEVELSLLGSSTPAESKAGGGTPVADFFGGDAALKSVASEAASAAVPPAARATNASHRSLSASLQMSKSKLLNAAKRAGAPSGPLLQDSLKPDQISLRAALQVRPCGPCLHVGGRLEGCRRCTRVGGTPQLSRRCCSS
jgi:hypothetical protein